MDTATLFSLKGRTALVTGGSRGIGKMIAAGFIAQGAKVYISSRKADVCDAAAAEMGPNCFSLPQDVSTVAGCQMLADEYFKHEKSLDILVNNAGVAHIGKADTTPEADFDRVMSINVKGVYQCIAAAIPGFRANGSGVIINMASIAAWVGLADRFVYSTAKGAVMAMTLSVAKDYMHENIRCNSISPARVHTPFVDGFIAKNYPGKEKEMFEKLSASQPIGRMAQPSEVAALALYLASDEASFITGCDYPIDGGFIKLNN